jgi:quercetin dioxygenase-like cupin family protein
MSEMSRIPVVAALAALNLLIAPVLALGDDVPDALSVEWQGKKPCEKLFEDAQVRVARCTFPPGTVHVCHSHPSYVAYFLHGGQVQLRDEKGTRKADIATDAFLDSPPVPWHEFANVGDSMVQALVIEKKYQPAPPLNQSVCPKTQ